MCGKIQKNILVTNIDISAITPVMSQSLHCKQSRLIVIYESAGSSPTVTHHAMNPLYLNNGGLFPGFSENDIQKDSDARGFVHYKKYITTVKLCLFIVNYFMNWTLPRASLSFWMSFSENPGKSPTLLKYKEFIV